MLGHQYYLIVLHFFNYSYSSNRIIWYACTSPQVCRGGTEKQVRLPVWERFGKEATIDPPILQTRAIGVHACSIRLGLE